MVGIDLAAGGTVFTTSVQRNLPSHKTEVPGGRLQKEPSPQMLLSVPVVLCTGPLVNYTTKFGDDTHQQCNQTIDEAYQPETELIKCQKCTQTTRVHIP